MGGEHTYAHMLPIIYAPLIVYVVLLALSRKEARVMTDWALFQTAALFVTVVLSVFRAKVLFANLQSHALMEAGWDMPYFFPDYLFGLDYIAVTPQLTILGYTPFYHPIVAAGKFLSNNAKALIHIMLSVPFVLAIGYGLWKKYKEDRGLFLLSATCLLVVLGGYNYIYFTASVSGQYKSFKLISFFLPLLIPSALIYFNDIRPGTKNALTGLLGLLIAINVVSSVLFLRHSFEGRYVDSELAEVQKVESMPHVESVNILGYNWWEVMWENVFLMKKKQYFQTNAYSGRSTDGRIDGQWDLFNVKGEDGSPQWCGLDEVSVNGAYKLRKAYRLSDAGMKAEISMIGRIDGVGAGSKINLPVKVKNISPVEWLTGCDDARKIYLSYVWYRVFPDGLHMENMSGAPLDRPLKPGGEAVINLPVKFPEEPGNYAIVLDMIQERVSWFGQKGSKQIFLEVSL